MTKGAAFGLGVAGLVLVAGTVLQARGTFPPAPASPAGAALAAAATVEGVAAEGRVVAYPGAEVRVGAERRGVCSAPAEEAAVRAASSRGDRPTSCGGPPRRGPRGGAEAEARLAHANLARRRQLAEERILAVHDLDQATRDVDTAEARVETARASVLRYEALLAKSRIAAPISGTVIARKVDAGQMVDTGDHTFTVADLGRLRIEGEAHEADAEAVVLGADVTITADGYPGHSGAAASRRS
jgi:multidrug efflux pump subunit AcrA (membrane-fusion protein)